MNNDRDKKEDTPARDCAAGSCCSGPGKWIWLALAVAVAGVLIAKNAGKTPTVPAPAQGEPPAAMVRSAAPTAASPPAPQGSPLPRLVDLGAGKCIPCQMMTPVLEELKKSYAGKLDVVFIDVWKEPGAGEKYGINVIPTQIFYDAAGKELFRHEGFFGKDDIVAKWEELGVDL